jgi:hypothetical protein
MLEKETVNGKYYKEVIKNFIAPGLSFSRVGPIIF